MAWTEEMVEELKRLWDEGVTTGEIGRRLNISKNSIVGKVHRLGLSGRPSPIKRKSDTSDDKTTTPTVKEKKDASPAKETKKEAKKETPISPSSHNTEPKTQKIAPSSTVQTKPELITTSSTIDEEEDIKLAKSLKLPQNNSPKKDRISLTDLDNHTCRWPIGDPKDDNFHFCGRKVRLGQTYCEEHSAIAYVKPTKK